MKLQIISKFNRNDNTKSNTNALPNHHFQGMKSPLNLEWLQDLPKDYYQLGNNRACQAKLQREEIKNLFLNFNTKCAIKYQSTAAPCESHRRRLTPILQILKQKQKPIQQTVIPITMKRIRLGRSTKSYTLETELNNSRKNIQDTQNNLQRVIKKIRKVNSLISLEENEPKVITLRRKPGFIKKKNLSLNGFEQKESCTNTSNKENLNYQSTNQQTKQKMSCFEDQLTQSKQRIDRIRKQLNDIYQMRKQPAHYKLKLF